MVSSTQPTCPALFPPAPDSNHDVLTGAAMLLQTPPQATVDWSRGTHLTLLGQSDTFQVPPTGTEKLIGLSLVAGAMRYEVGAMRYECGSC